MDNTVLVALLIVFIIGALILTRRPERGYSRWNGRPLEKDWDYNRGWGGWPSGGGGDWGRRREHGEHREHFR